MLLANSAQIREADRIQIEEKGLPGVVLMESAGRQAALRLMSLYPGRQEVLILAGPGNNGGDGLVMARYLHLAGRRVQVLLSHDAGRYQGDALLNYRLLRQLPVPVGLYSRQEAESCLGQFAGQPLLVDALLGTGIQSALRPPISEIIEFFRQRQLECIAVDLPSGLNADTGEVMNDVIPARHTFTFQLPKICHYLTPAANACGQIHTFDIGIWPQVVEQLGIKRRLVTDEFVRAHPPKRPSDAHKGHFGHVLVIGGSRQFAGAPAMAAFACVHAGAGLCTAAVPAGCSAPCYQLCPEVMCAEVGAEGHFTLGAIEQLLPLMEGKSAVVLGPGLGTHPETADFFAQLIPHISLPLILDADGLNLLARQPGLWKHLPSPAILTPHPGEMARLCQVERITHRRLEYAESLAKERQVVVVLKGAGTLTALPDGNTFVNTSGNPGMATGGSGDVLTGIIAALLGQGYAPAVAAPMGVYLHGKTGDAVAAVKGQPGLTATDIGRALGQVWLELLK